MKVSQEIIKQLIMFHKSIRILNELQGNYKIKYGSIKILQKCKKNYKIIVNLMLDWFNKIWQKYLTKRNYGDIISL